jgi:hypothetical protein
MNPLFLLHYVTLLAVTTPTKDTPCPGNPTFFGLVPWYQYLKIGRDPVTLKCEVMNFNALPPNGTTGGAASTSSFLLIGIAVVDDLLRIAGIAAFAYVVYGGVRYITSQGSPEGAAQAQATIMNGLIGLVIALLSVAIVSFIGSKLV